MRRLCNLSSTWPLARRSRCRMIQHDETESNYTMVPPMASPSPRALACVDASGPPVRPRRDVPGLHR
eukprot:6108059-Pyramimonas_sp.AAC.1